MRRLSPRTAATEAPSVASPNSFDGLWVREKSECADEDGKTRTLIKFDNKIDGKLVPLFDQYENNCVINSQNGSPNSTDLAAICFAFWQDFTKRADGKKTTIRLSRIAGGGITIDEHSYYRCESDDAKNNRRFSR